MVTPAPPRAPEVKGKRIFVIENRDHEDPDTNMTVDEVRQFYAHFFPELSNAEVNQSKRGIDDVYTFTARVGRKGVSANGRA